MCVSTGVTPATDFLKDSGLSITERGFVTVDKVSASILRSSATAPVVSTRTLRLQ